MGWTLTESKVRKLTRHLANEFADMEACPHDRPLNARRMAYLKSAVDEGQFRPPHWVQATCDGKVYRINGKHTSTVLSAMNGDFPKELFASVESYNCDTLEDVAKLYASFDRRESARLTGDINRAFAASNQKLAGIPDATINLAVTGMATALWDANYFHIRTDVRAHLLLEHPSFVCWLYQLFKDTPEKQSSRHIRRGPVVGAMFLTYGRARSASTAFWSLVRDGSGPDNSTADRKLYAYLLSTHLTGGRGERLGGGVSMREMMVKCIHGWNAWRSGEPTNLSYHAKSPVPIPSK